MTLAYIRSVIADCDLPNAHLGTMGTNGFWRSPITTVLKVWPQAWAIFIDCSRSPIWRPCKRRTIGTEGE